MEVYEFALVAVAFSMNSFAVFLSKGLSFKKCVFGHIVLMVTIFALFQTAVIVVSYSFDMLFESVFALIGKHITCGIFLLLGIKMLNDGIRYGICIRKQNKKKRGEEHKHKHFKNSSILSHLLDFFLLGFVTSIDAFATGFFFAALHIEMILLSCFIFTATFTFSFISGWFGSFFGKKMAYMTQILGGLIFILLVVKAVFYNKLGAFCQITTNIMISQRKELQTRAL